jgi:hypothetical protein
MSEIKMQTQEEKGKILAAPVHSFLAKIGNSLGIEPEALKETVRLTVMPKGASNAELLLFLSAAARLDLNPLTGEIYAFPKSQGGIQVVAGKNAFNVLNNRNAAYDGREFFYWYKIGDEVRRVNHAMDGELVQVECHIYLKTRPRPEIAFALMKEYRRDTAPWRQTPTTMLEHKAYIKASTAFGYGDICDIDDALRFCDVSKAPVIAREEVAGYILPAVKSAHQESSAPAQGVAMATQKQRGYLYGLALALGKLDEKDAKAWLQWRGTPSDKISYQEASGLIAQMETCKKNGEAFQEFERLFEGKPFAEPELAGDK